MKHNHNHGENMHKTYKNLNHFLKPLHNIKTQTTTKNQDIDHATDHNIVSRYKPQHRYNLNTKIQTVT